MTQIVRRTFPATITEVGPNEVEVVISTSALAADGDIWMTAGVDLQRYRGNPVWLWDHDPKTPIARAENITIAGDELKCRVLFAPAGISPKADEIRGLVKAGIINGVSAGALPLEMEPLDPKRPKGGQRWLRWELYESSFVSVPSNVQAGVTARAAAIDDWKVGASRALAIDDTEGWYGAEAAAGIFTWAGGDDFDPDKARKGFLVYNAADPKKRGSYKLPIARVVSGELKVPKRAIAAAEGGYGIDAAGLPDDVKTEAQAVVDHYKEKVGMTEDAERAAKDLRLRMLPATPKLKMRDLYDVSQLAYMLSGIGYLHDSAAWEAEIEADDSKVPAMLGEAMKSLGQTLIAMTTEEVDELLKGHGVQDGAGVTVVEVEVDDLPAPERSFVMQAPAGRIRAFRRGIALARIRAAETSTGDGTAKTMQDAAEHATRALERSSTAKGGMDAAITAHEDATDQHSRAASAHDKVGQDLEALNGSAPADVADKIAKAQQHHRTLGKALDGIAAQHSALAEAHGTCAAGMAGATRSMRGVQRCLRSLLDTDDGAAATVPEDAEDTAEKRAADLRRRTLSVLELADGP